MIRRSFHFFLVGVFAFVLLFAFSKMALGGGYVDQLESSLKMEQSDIMQFTAGGQVLGFGPGKVYMVGLGSALIEEFVGASRVIPVAGSSTESPSSQDAAAKDSGAPPFQGVTYPELWEGITVRYDRAAGGLAESVYVLQPGADAGDIRIRYNADFIIENDGSLRFEHPTKKGYYTLSRPFAWQEIDGRKAPVAVSFQDYGDRTLGFSVVARNPNYTLFIDPTYQWHTFYGSGAASPDYGRGIAVTADGIYVTGYSYATWNGDGDTAPMHAYSGSYDIVVLKLSPAGVYQWHTFYGSANVDHGYGIAVTADSVYVTGFSSATWNGDGDTAPLHAYCSSQNIVVLKLSTSGAYQWHTFYGCIYGSYYSQGTGISVTADGVYVAGLSTVGWNGDGDTGPIHPHGGVGAFNIVVLKLSPAGVYQWHTFYGSANVDRGYGIAVTADSVYVTGDSSATWNGDGDTAPLHAHSGSGDYDIVVLKLSTSGAYQWHTFYGSADKDTGYGIATTADGVYLTGESESTWDGGNAPIHAHSGGIDIAVIKLSPAGVYQWHTFYGSANNDHGYAISVAADGVYVTGDSGGTWNGDGDTAPMHAHSGLTDIVALKLSTAGVYQWHTFYGSSGGDYGYGIATTADESVHVTGHSYYTWNGDGDTGPIHAFNGDLGFDIVVLKLAKSYPVTYNANNATSGTAPPDQTKTYGVDLTLATNTGSLEKTGYDFTGWNTNNDGSGTHYDAGATYTGNAALTLYAEWTIKTYTVTYDGNGNTGGTAPTDGNTYQEGADVTVLGTGTLVKTGYTFNNWNTAADGGGNPYSPGDSFNMPGANVTLYAQWTFGSTRYVCSDGICGNNTPCHKTISEAAQAATTGTLILIAAEEQDGGFSLDADKDLTLQGGWDKTFNNPNGGTTTLHGAPKAPQGSLTFQNLKINP